MKKLWMFFGFILMGVVSAGNIETHFMFNEIMATGETIRGVMRSRSMELRKIDVGVVSVSSGESVIINLSTGYAYYISVAGQKSRVSEVHARVYDPAGVLVGLDTSKTNYPNIRVIPTLSGTYRVDVTVIKMLEGYGGGWGYCYVGVGAIQIR